MNNSKIAIENATLMDEPEIDITPWLVQRQKELTEIIEAIRAINSSSYWKVLQNKVFQGSLEVLERQIRTERDSKEMFRLQGQLGWAEKFTNLEKLSDVYRKELENVNKQLKKNG